MTGSRYFKVYGQGAGTEFYPIIGDTFFYCIAD